MLEYAVLAMFPNVICIALGLMLALKVRKYTASDRNDLLFSIFILIPVLSAVWAMQRLVAEPDAHMFLVAVEYALDVSLLVCILFFSLQYAGYGGSVNRRNVAIVSILGAILVLTNATNPWHHLFYASLEIESSYGLSAMQATYGPFFLIWLAYSLGILLLTMFFLVRAGLESVGEKRVSLGLIVLGIGIYTTFGILYAMIDRDPRLDLLTIGLTFAAILIYHADRRGHFIDQYRITIHEAIRAMGDGVIILDPSERPVYMNDIARELLEQSDSDSFKGIGKNPGTDLKLRTGDVDRDFSVMRSPIVRHGNIIGNVVVLRDITDRKGMERLLANSNHRLGTMTRVLRHDVQNDLMALNAHLELLGNLGLDAKQSERLEKARKAAVRLNGKVELAREHHLVSPTDPVWQDLRSTIEAVAGNMDLDGIEFVNEVSNCHLFADPMLPKVFHNLLDNSIRHGGAVRKVRVYVEQRANEVRIIWEDDGQGISKDDKDRIFQKGFGKNTGQGLFLVRDLLSLTDLGIYEDGEAGSGARFVISIPVSSFRSFHGKAG